MFKKITNTNHIGYIILLVMIFLASVLLFNNQILLGRDLEKKNLIDSMNQFKKNDLFQPDTLKFEIKIRHDLYLEDFTWEF